MHTHVHEHTDTLTHRHTHTYTHKQMWREFPLAAEALESSSGIPFLPFPNMGVCLRWRAGSSMHPAEWSPFVMSEHWRREPRIKAAMCCVWLEMHRRKEFHAGRMSGIQESVQWYPSSAVVKPHLQKKEKTVVETYCSPRSVCTCTLSRTHCRRRSVFLLSPTSVIYQKNNFPPLCRSPAPLLSFVLL